MKLIENIINHKINTITADELIKFGEKFQISITKSQAAKIAAYMRGKGINIFNDSERTKLIREIAKVAGPETARKVNQLFIQFTK